MKPLSILLIAVLFSFLISCKQESKKSSGNWKAVDKLYPIVTSGGDGWTNVSWPSDKEKFRRSIDSALYAEEEAKQLGYKIVVIRGHEYIEAYGHKSYTHLVNCKYCKKQKSSHKEQSRTTENTVWR